MAVMTEGTATGRAGRTPRRLTRARLEQAALAHVARYACSSAQLRRVLERRVARAADARLLEADAGDVAAILARLTRAGVLDDLAFARMKAASLGRQGRSGRALALALRRFGLDAAAVEAGLAAAGRDGAAELARAVIYARRRRLGPFRRAADRAARRDRDLAALARQGFAYNLSRRVIEAADEAALDRLVEEG